MSIIILKRTVEKVISNLLSNFIIGLLVGSFLIIPLVSWVLNASSSQSLGTIPKLVIVSIIIVGIFVYNYVTISNEMDSNKKTKS